MLLKLVFSGFCETGYEVYQAGMDIAAPHILVQSPVGKPAQVAGPSLLIISSLQSIGVFFCRLGLWVSNCEVQSKFLWRVSCRCIVCFRGHDNHMQAVCEFLSTYFSSTSNGSNWKLVSPSCSYMENYVDCWMLLWSVCKAWGLHWMWNVPTFRSQVSKLSVHCSWPLPRLVPSSITVQIPASSTW